VNWILQTKLYWKVPNKSYLGCTKVTTDYWDIKLSVTTSFIGNYLRNDWTNFYDQTCIGKCLSNCL